MPGNIYYEIGRFTQYRDLTIANGATLSNAFDFRAFTMAVVHMPDAWTTANLGFFVSTHPSGGYQPLRDHNGQIVQVSSPVTGSAYELPPELAGCHYVQLWSQTVGTGTAQGAARPLTVDLKG